MKVEGTRSYSAPRETLWEVLNDPERMAKVMPGVESFDVLDDRNWLAHVLIPLGLGGLRMKINVEKAEERKPEYARLHAKGEGVGALLSMDTQFHLSEEGGATAMRWEADVRVAGPVGSMGQPASGEARRGRGRRGGRPSGVAGNVLAGARGPDALDRRLALPAMAER